MGLSILHVGIGVDSGKKRHLYNKAVVLEFRSIAESSPAQDAKAAHPFGKCGVLGLGSQRLWLGRCSRRRSVGCGRAPETKSFGRVP